MDLVFQGRAWLNRGYSSDMLGKARSFFARALELDPDNVEALVGVGRVDGALLASMTDDPAPIVAAAEGALTKALALAPNHALAHWRMGMLLCETNRTERGLEELDRALAIDPNMAKAHATGGLAKVFIGRAEEAEAHFQEALRLSPRDAMVSAWFSQFGLAKASLGEYEAAVGWLRKSIDANRNTHWAYFQLAACLAHLGRLDEARKEVKAGLAINPKFTIKRFRAGAQSDNAVFLAQRERVIEGMRLAGFPEG
jgi:tetratricopeptide (TPR) repeat protein